MRHVVFLVPGDPATLTGGYIYDQRIALGLRAAGWQVDVRSPGDGFPAPDAAARAGAAAMVEALPDGAVVLVDGLAFGVLPEVAERHARRLRWVALVHHPLALETGLDAAEAHALFESERRALAVARRVIVTSPATARSLAGYDVPPARITVVEPGCEPAPLAQGSGSDTPALLCVASLTPRKGHAVLIEALAGLRARRWVLHCAGSAARDADTAAALRKQVARHGLTGRVLWHGELDGARLDALYARADVFVLPSFHEGYGMALAEALARGLPVISTTAGAIVDTVPADAGVLLPPGDAGALRAALQRVLDEPAWCAALAAGAREARRRLPTWPAAVARCAAVLEEVAHVADERRAGPPQASSPRSAKHGG